MWLYTKYGFVSIIEADNNKDKLQVRAREPKVLKKLFSKYKIIRSPEKDYLYRCIVPRADVARVIANMICDIDYCNFKNSVRDMNYHNVLEQVWNNTLALEQSGYGNREVNIFYKK